MPTTLPVNYLHEMMRYDPETGLFAWIERPVHHFKDCSKSAQHLQAIWNAQYAGKEAFKSANLDGYKASTISGARLTGHRTAWAMHHGEWPNGEIDHINGNRSDNRICNLRCVTRRQNAKNLSVKSGSERGVYWYAQTNRWVAKAYDKGRAVHLGYFANKADAQAARQKAEVELGYHANHGRKQPKNPTQQKEAF